MSYAAMAELAKDDSFRVRVGSCVIEQARGRDLDTDQVARLVLISPEQATERFVPVLVTEPSFAELYQQSGSDGITDGLILSGVQAVWPVIEAVLSAPPRSLT